LWQNVDLEQVLVRTGQRFDDMMSEVFRKPKVPPQEQLAIHGGGHGQM
jgi:UDP-N-acetylglucosamine 2-epimerase